MEEVRVARRGPLIAAAIVITWSFTLVAGLSGHLPCATAPATPGLVLLRTFLHTGLFVVAHDAIHGTLFPASSLANRLAARGFLALYALLPYGRCRRNHFLHHRQPAGSADPDVPVGGRRGFAPWFVKFLGAYLSLPQFLGLGLLWALTLALSPGGWETSLAHLVLWWVLPLLLSALQLFLFGTYLPHRWRGAEGLHVDSTPLPPWLSLLTCYHFGYHREHHDHPFLPWYELPAARRRSVAPLAP